MNQLNPTTFCKLSLPPLHVQQLKPLQGDDLLLNLGDGYENIFLFLHNLQHLNMNFSDKAGSGKRKIRIL